MPCQSTLKLRHVAAPSCAKGKPPCRALCCFSLTAGVVDGIGSEGGNFRSRWSSILPYPSRSFLYFSMEGYFLGNYVSFGFVFCFLFLFPCFFAFLLLCLFAFPLFPALLLYIALYSASPVFCFFASLLLRSCCFFASLLLHCAASLLLRFSLLFCFSSFCASLLPAFPCFFACLLFCFYALPSFFFSLLILQIILEKHHKINPKSTINKPQTNQRTTKTTLSEP